MNTIQQSLDGGKVDEHKDEEQCPVCGKWFKEIGKHWWYNSEHRPSFTEKQREILIGSLLGDGSYNYRYDYFQWKDMIVLPYLKWLQNKFGLLSNSIYSDKSPSKTAEGLQKAGKTTQEEDCSQGLTLTTKPHPELSFCEEWGYSEDGFESYFPDDVSLTPTILKVWYVSDGSLHWKNGRFTRINITNSNQIHRTNYIKSLFKEIGINVTISNINIIIGKNQTEQFFDYIGEPPTDSDAGFKYKWQYDNYDEYRRLFDVMKSQPYWDRENECLIEDNNE